MKANSDLYQTAPQFNFSVRLKPLGNLWSVNEVITSCPLSLHVFVLFTCLRPRVIYSLNPFVVHLFGLWFLQRLSDYVPVQKICQHVTLLTGPIISGSSTECFFCTRETDTIPLSSHYSTNCKFPREKRVPSPGLHSITFHPSDSPLWITAETHCHFWSKVIQWDTNA